jgi:hypothetical protein
MTLATITALINSKIRNKTPEVLKTEHADVEQAIVNEVFSGLKYEEVTGATQLPTNTIIDSIGVLSVDVDVKLTFCKKGNIVFVNGQIENKEPFSLSIEMIFKFKPLTEFVPAGGVLLQYHNNNSFGRLFYLAGGNVSTDSPPLVAGERYHINGFYYVNQ